MLVIGDFHNIGFYLYHEMSIGQSRLTTSSGLIRNIAGYHFACITATNSSPSSHIQIGQNFLFPFFDWEQKLEIGQCYTVTPIELLNIAISF